MSRKFGFAALILATGCPESPNTFQGPRWTASGYAAQPTRAVNDGDSWVTTLDISFKRPKGGESGWTSSLVMHPSVVFNDGEFLEVRATDEDDSELAVGTFTQGEDYYATPVSLRDFMDACEVGADCVATINLTFSASGSGDASWDAAFTARDNEVDAEQKYVEATVEVR